MTRAAAIAAAERYFDEGGFVADLARRVAIPTESQVEERLPVLHAYLADEIAPSLARLGFQSEIVDNPINQAGGRGGPVLIAERREDDAATTVFGYGHGDVIRGLEPQWRDGLSPWQLQQEGDRLYGRGTADNKGQHTINLAALDCVLKTRGRLGFNAVFLIETGEEIGSPGLREVCRQHKDRLAADVLIASDGPRLAPERPTIFLGARGAMNFDLVGRPARRRPSFGQLGRAARQSRHHPGARAGDDHRRQGRDPGARVGPDAFAELGARGAGRLPGGVHGGEDAPEIDPDWGEPGLSPSEKVFGWCSFEVLAFATGNPDNPVNAIPPKRQGDLPDPLCRRRRSREFPSRAAPPPRRARLSDGDDRAVEESLFSGNPARPRPPLGALDRRLDRGNHRQDAGHPAQSRRLAAQRHLRRRSRPADDLGSAFLCRLLAARAQRAPARPGGARGAAGDGRDLLGPRRGPGPGAYLTLAWAERFCASLLVIARE